MQLAPRARPTRGRSPGGSVLAAAGPAVVGLAWLAVALAAAWVVFATPLLSDLAGPGSGSAGGSAVAVVVWAVALTAPAAFAILGLARLGAAMNRVRVARRRVPPVTRIADRLPPGSTVYPRIRLPDGRRIPDVVVGPHGIALFEPLPPLQAVRRSGDRWEVRFSDRRYRQIENPLHRAIRDGERLRRHLDAQERDFTVRVHVAVLGDPAAVTRTEGCAVVALDDVPAWLAALPAQRGLTSVRLEHLHDVIGALG